MFWCQALPSKSTTFLWWLTSSHTHWFPLFHTSTSKFFLHRPPPHHVQTTFVATDPPPQANKDKDNHWTFIEANFRLDNEFYLLYPNNKTTFVLKPSDKGTNFGHIGFPATNQNKAGSGPNKAWKIVCCQCLGLMRCSNVLCTFLAAPTTVTGKLQEKMSWWVSQLCNRLTHQPHIWLTSPPYPFQIPATYSVVFLGACRRRSTSHAQGKCVALIMKNQPVGTLCATPGTTIILGSSEESRPSYKSGIWEGGS